MFSFGPELPGRMGYRAQHGVLSLLVKGFAHEPKTYHISSLQSWSQEGNRTTDREIKAQHGKMTQLWSHSKAGMRPPEFTPLQHAHPVLIEVVSLHAGPLEAELALAAAGAICPGKVAGLAHHLPLGLAGAPQFGAVLHVGTGLGAHTEGQLALLAQGIAGPRQVLGQGDGLAGLVQEAVSCREPRACMRDELGEVGLG